MKIRNKLCEKKIKEVRHLLVEKPTTVGPSDDISTVILKVNEDLKTRHVYVVDEDNVLVGSVRMYAILKYLFPYSSKLTNGLTMEPSSIYNVFASDVAEIMKKDPLFVKDDQRLDDCAEIMLREGVNELPVVDDNMKLIGQINVYEIIEAYKEFHEQNKD